MNKQTIIILLAVLLTWAAWWAYFFFSTNSATTNSTTTNNIQTNQNWTKSDTKIIELENEDFSYVMDFDVNYSSVISWNNDNWSIIVKWIEWVSYDKWLKNRIKIWSVESNSKKNWKITVNDIEYIQDEENIYYKNLYEIINKINHDTWLNLNQLQYPLSAAWIDLNKLENSNFLKDDSLDQITKMIWNLNNIKIVNIYLKSLFTGNPSYYLEKNWFYEILSKEYLTKGAYKKVFDVKTWIGDKLGLTLKPWICDNFDWIDFGNTTNWTWTIIDECKDNIEMFNKTYSQYLYLIEKWNIDTIWYKKDSIWELSYWNWEITSFKFENDMLGNIDYNDWKIQINIDPLPLKILWQSINIQSLIYTKNSNAGYLKINYKMPNWYWLLNMNTAWMKITNLDVDAKIELAGYVWSLQGKFDKSKWDLSIKVDKWKTNIILSQYTYQNWTTDLSIKADKLIIQGSRKNVEKFNVGKWTISSNYWGNKTNLTIDFKVNNYITWDNSLPDFLIKFNLKNSNSNWSIIFNLDKKLTEWNLIGRYKYDDWTKENLTSWTFTGNIKKWIYDITRTNFDAKVTDTLKLNWTNKTDWNTKSFQWELNIDSSEWPFKLSYNWKIENKKLPFYIPINTSPITLNIKIPNSDKSWKLMWLIIGMFFM